MQRNRVPVSVAVTTLMLIVIVTMVCTSFTQISALIASGGVDAVPRNLECRTIPGVIIGDQIGPLLQGKVSQRSAALRRGA